MPNIVQGHVHNRLSHPSFGGDVRSGARDINPSSQKGTIQGGGASSGDSADVFDDDCITSSECHSGSDEDIDSKADELMLSQQSD